MKITKIFAGVFLGLESFILLVFFLSLLDWSWLNVNILAIAVLAVFLIFLNILSIVILLGNEKK